MIPKLSVILQIDLDGKYVTLDVTGTLTEINQQALPPLLERSRALFPQAVLTVDLRRAELGEPAAIDLLTWSLQDGPPGTAPVRITAPVPLDPGSLRRPVPATAAGGRPPPQNHPRHLLDGRHHRVRTASPQLLSAEESEAVAGLDAVSA